MGETSQQHVLLFHYYDFSGRIAVGFVGTAELQGAADGDGDAVDIGGVFEGDDVGGGIVPSIAIMPEWAALENEFCCLIMNSKKEGSYCSIVPSSYRQVFISSSV